jgi:AhpD family alkylhydroperoxidase
MSNALAHVTWEPCCVEPRHDRELETYARKRMGMPHGALRYYAAVPWLARSQIDLHPEYGLLVHLDQRTADLIGLVVSQENACRFCFAAVRAILWFQGMDRERIQRVELEVARADLPPKVRATLDYARIQSRSGPAGAHAAWDALRAAGVGAAEAREIAFIVALVDSANRVHTALAIPPVPMERMPDQWIMRLLRPFFQRVMRSHHWRGTPAVAESVPADLPYARMVAAYAGSPIASALLRTLNEMLASPHLTRRCKLLMFGVISRGLPCALCETEIGRALQRDGLDPAALTRLLTHLDGPELDGVERLLLPYARETLWYQPAVLQRHTRLLREHLNAEQLIEAVGVASLANGLCRMAAVVMAEPV